MQVYGNSKLMQILSAIQLQRLFLASTNPEDNKIATHSVYPGYVGSEISNKDHYKLPKFVTNFIDKAVKLTATCKRPCLPPANMATAGISGTEAGAAMTFSHRHGCKTDSVGCALGRSWQEGELGCLLGRKDSQAGLPELSMQRRQAD